MTNRPGRKGYSAEAPVLAYLKRRGFRHTFRHRYNGARDKGDIGNIEGVCIEIKNQARYKIAEWMAETLIEKHHAQARTAAMVMKPMGVGETRVDQWWAVLTLADYVQLLIDAGYGPYEPEHDVDAPLTQSGIR